MINAHDFVQLALYQTIISALWYLGETDKLHIYLQKYMGTYKISTFKDFEIDEALQLGLVSKSECKFIRSLKRFRDSQGVAHLTIYFDKEVEEGKKKREEVERFVSESEGILNKLLKISNEIGIVHMQEAYNLMNDRKIKVGEIIQLGHSKEELLKVLKSK
jgi:hypothetical protein